MHYHETRRAGACCTKWWNASPKPSPEQGSDFVFQNSEAQGPQGPKCKSRCANQVQKPLSSISQRPPSRPSFSMAWRVAKASAARSGSSRGTGHDKTMPQKKNRVPCAKQLHKDAPRQIVISIGRRKTYNDDTFRNWSTSSRTPCERRHTQVI